MAQRAAGARRFSRGHGVMTWRHTRVWDVEHRIAARARKTSVIALNDREQVWFAFFGRNDRLFKRSRYQKHLALLYSATLLPSTRAATTLAIPHRYFRAVACASVRP